MTTPHLPAASVSLPTAASALAAGFLDHCLSDAVTGLPYDLERVRELLRDDDVYFVAADRLVDRSRARGWRALAADLAADGCLAAYRCAVLEHGCGSAYRNGFEVIFFGELDLGEPAA